MARPICETIRSVCTMHIDRNSTRFVAIVIIINMVYHPNTVYDYLGEEQSELNWTKMRERVFSPW